MRNPSMTLGGLFNILISVKNQNEKKISVKWKLLCIVVIHKHAENVLHILIKT